MILFLTRQIPYPPDVGLRIRQLNLLTAYARVGPVQLVFAYESEAELAGMKALEPLCAGMHPVRFDWSGKAKAPGLTQWRKDLREFGALRPFQASHFFSRELQRKVEELALECRLIHVERLYLMPHVEALLSRRANEPGAGLRLILDLDDIETRLRSAWLRFKPPEGRLARIAETLDLALLQRYQARALRSFDRTLVCSKHDREALHKFERISVIPNGASLQTTRAGGDAAPESDTSDGRTLLCLGTYGYWPNVDALLFFIERILPLIRQKIPDVRVLVVGRDMPPEISALHDGAAVQVSADVPSVAPFYRKSTLSVVPLRLGGGTRVKILEAFAQGCPVVSTSVGCEGLEVGDREHLIIADAPEAFASACIELMGDPTLRAQLARRGRALVEQQYSWESIQERVVEVATTLLGDGT